MRLIEGSLDADAEECADQAEAECAADSESTCTKRCADSLQHAASFRVDVAPPSGTDAVMHEPQRTVAEYADDSDALSRVGGGDFA